jgi:Asp-tRNA(Asn)/Glu-tRNA(Gln) amidotransferase A subunit family amidase
MQSIEQSGNFNVGKADLIRIDYIAFNTHAALKDPRVRQAISYAFDYDGYVNGVLKGEGRRAKGPFPRSLAFYDPKVFVYPTDLDKAKALLQEAGWVDGTEVTYAYYPGFHGEDVGPILQAQLEQIGIKLKIQELDISGFNGIFYGEQTLERVTLAYYQYARELSAADVVWAERTANQLRRSAGRFLEAYDLLLTPTLMRLPESLGKYSQSRDDIDFYSFFRLCDELCVHMPLFNLTGQPAISLPLGTSASGLPIGVQFAARFGREDLLLRLAAVFEQALPWRARRPVVHVSSVAG